MRDEIIKHPYSKETIRYDDYIAGLAKGMEVLEAFGHYRQRLNITQVAERTKFTRAAVCRHLKTLKYLGYLDSDGTFFWLTHKILKISGSYMRSATLPKITEPLLFALTEKTGFYHAVVLLDNHEVVTVACSCNVPENHSVLPYGIHNGNRIPAHSASNGKMLLSYLSDEELEQWLERYELGKYTKFTITDKNKLKQQLKEAHERGWAYSEEEHEIGFNAIAVPIFNSSGEVVASLNTVARKEYADIEQLQKKCLLEMIELAKKIRHLL